MGILDKLFGKGEKKENERIKIKENEKLFNFKKVSRKDHNAIDIDWLPNNKPMSIEKFKLLFL